MDFASIEDGGDTIALGLSKKKSILFVNNVLMRIMRNNERYTLLVYCKLMVICEIRDYTVL